MSEEITTTEWKSAFSLDSTENVTGTSSMQTVFRYDGTYYWIIHSGTPSSSDNWDHIRITVPFSDLYYYDPSSAQWCSTGEDTNFPFMDLTGYHIEKGWLVAESWNDSELSSYYYSREQFDTRFLPAPTGTVFDSIYLSSPLDGVTALLPVVLALIVGVLAVRKGISYVRENLSRG